MNQAVFISDLHLHPDMPEITSRFMTFLSWAKLNTTSLYILGDFFHVWMGDDCIGDFEKKIAQALLDLNQSGIDVYWMPGNRDFLMGQKFLNMCGMTFLPDPSVIALPGLRLLVAHGDAYCLNDYGHRCLRALTRCSWQRQLILALPKWLRQRLIQAIREKSQRKAHIRPANSNKYAIVQSALFKDMQRNHVTHVVYGHIHQPNIKETFWKNWLMKEHILSDWDVNPKALCYNVGKGIYFLDNF